MFKFSEQFIIAFAIVRIYQKDSLLPCNILYSFKTMQFLRYLRYAIKMKHCVCACDIGLSREIVLRASVWYNELVIRNQLRFQGL